MKAAASEPGSIVDFTAQKSCHISIVGPQAVLLVSKITGNG